MKKLVFLCLCAILAAGACKNDKPVDSAAQAPETPAMPAYNMGDMQQKQTAAQSTQQQFETTLKELDRIQQSLKGAKAAEAEALRNELSDIRDKHQMMIDQYQAAMQQLEGKPITAPGANDAAAAESVTATAADAAPNAGVPLSPEQLKAIIEDSERSFEAYRQALEETAKKAATLKKQ